jgi:hypothetical protein
MNAHETTGVRELTTDELELVSGAEVNGKFHMAGTTVRWNITEGDTATVTTVCVGSDAAPTCEVTITPK